MPPWFIFLYVLAALASAPIARADEGSDRALAALKSGRHYALMRHAKTPGAKAPGRNDPDEFRIGDCATQRNLDAGGRAQAAAIGAGLRRAGITIFKVARAAGAAAWRRRSCSRSATWSRSTC